MFMLGPSLVLAWSCASAPDNHEHDVDPNIPELDASWSPRPKKPGAPDEPLTPVPAGDLADASGGSDASVGGAADAAPKPLAPPTDHEMPRAARGEVVITEVMFDPTGPEPASEWFEIWNGKASARSLAGLTLRDGAGRTHVIVGAMGEVAVPPDRYVVLARDRAAAVAGGVPAETIVYEYGTNLTSSEGIQLANGASGAIALFDGDAEISSIAYGANQLTNVDGRSAQLDDTGTWKLATATPGAATR